MIKRKTCLLVLPRNFYSFANLIGQGLDQLGYDVATANEEYPDNVIGKLMGKFDLEISRRITRKVINRDYLEGQHYDLVLIIKGRGVGRRLMKDFRAHADRIVGYHFDTLDYDVATKRWAADCDRVSTFDYRDAAAEGWPLVELFSGEAPPDDLPEITIRLSAVMRNHSERLEYLDRVSRALELEPEEVSAYIFEQDFRTLAFNFSKHPRLYWRWRKHIHRKALPYEDYRRILGSSDFTVDYAHPKQTGLTMRCLESLASATKLITNNPEIRNSKIFSSENYIVFEQSDDPLILRREVGSLSGTRPQPRWRSARDCLAEIIG